MEQLYLTTDDIIKCIFTVPLYPRSNKHSMVLHNCKEANAQRPYTATILALRSLHTLHTLQGTQLIVPCDTMANNNKNSKLA